MKIVHALCLFTLWLPAGVLAQSCRQSWMPPDAPVFCPWDMEIVNFRFAGNPFIIKATKFPLTLHARQSRNWREMTHDAR